MRLIWNEYYGEVQAEIDWCSIKDTPGCEETTIGEKYPEVEMTWLFR